MERKYKFVVAVLVLHAIVVSLILVFNWSRERVFNPDDIYPITHDNLLIFSVRVNEISNSLNKMIKKTNLELPEIKFSNSNSSYKSPDQNWIMVNNELILITLFHDVASVLNSAEVQAVAIHELCHFILGHKETNPLLQERNINKEKEADKCTISFRVNTQVLISAITKLSLVEEEKLERTSALAVN